MDRNKRNAQLIESYLSGDAEAGEALIVENCPLIKATVRRVLNKWPSYSHLRNDLIGEGYLTLTKVVQELTETPQSFRNLVITAVRHALLKYVSHGCGKHPYYDEHRNTNIGLESLPETLVAFENPNIQAIENRDFLFSLCVSEKERSILALYFEGGTPHSIATALGYTVNIVKHTVSRFKIRVRSQLGSV